jgi:hypothetical protein
MAEVYRRVHGKKLEKFIATMPGVHAYTGSQAAAGAELAQGILNAHRHFGHSRIEIEEGETDWLVSLNDDRGQAAAISIEFGREVRNPSTPVWALHMAFALKTKR